MYSLRCLILLPSLSISPPLFFSTLISPVSHYTYPSGWCRSRQPYRRGRAGTRKQRLIPTRVTDPLNRTLKTCFIDDSPYNNLTPIPTLKWRLPTLLNSNTRSIVHKIDEMTNIIDDNEVDIACVTRKPGFLTKSLTVLLTLMGTLVKGGTELIGEGGRPCLH